MESQNIGSLGAVGLASIIGRLRCRSNSKAGTAFSDLAACVIPRERRGKGEERGKYRNSVRGRGEPVVVRMELSRAANERAQWEGGFVQSNSPGIGSVFGRAAQPSFCHSGGNRGGISSALHTASITRGSGGDQSLDLPISSCLPNCSLRPNLVY